MEQFGIFFVFYLIAVNLFAVFITALDKSRAIRGKWRVSEAALLWTAALGGCPAMLLTMLAIRHKTRKKKFMIGLPVILALQITAAFLVGRLFYG